MTTAVETGLEGESSVPSRGSRFVETIAYVVAAAFLFLAIAETGTRIANRHGRIYDIEMFKYARALKRDAPAEAPMMHHWHIPGAAATLQGVRIAINSHGLRDDEHEYATPPAVSRVLVLGDSITLGWGVPQRQSYPKVLEDVLNEGRPEKRYEVINAGVGNYTTSRIIGLYRYELYKYSAPIVVFAFFINNANETPDGALRFVFDTPLQFPVLLWSRARRVAARYGVGKDFDAYYAELYDDSNPAYQRFKAQLSGFLGQLRDDGKRVVVVSIPDVFHLDEPRYRYQPITDKVFAIATAEGARTLDLFPALQGLRPAEIMNTPEDRHPNVEGHRRMGRALYAFMAGWLAEEQR